jgi:GTP-binding protein
MTFIESLPPEVEEAPIDGKTVEFKWDTYHEDTMADLSDDLDDEDWDEDEYDVEVEYRK